MTIRVLVVDDSALARKIISECLASDPQIEVIGTASSADAAWNRMQRTPPDVITLDAVMAPVDGVTFLRDYMKRMPTPTVLVSSLGGRGTKTSVQALGAGALSVVAKPDGFSEDALGEMRVALLREVKAAARTKVRRAGPVGASLSHSGGTGAREPQAIAKASPGEPEPRAPTPSLAPLPARALGTHEGTKAPLRLRPRIIGIGASTGGAAALTQILPLFPGDCPPIVIVDHMPEGFTREFAARLDERCAARVVEATEELELGPGTIAIAPGGTRHCTVEKQRSGRYVVRLTTGEKVNGHRPSVNVLFRSLAREAGAEATAALLTGMGRDGAEGLLAMRRAGAYTIAQDEESSVVFGMPKAALELDAAWDAVPLESVPARLLGTTGRG